MISIVTIFAVISTVSAGVFTENAAEQKSLWESFKKDFGKVYTTMEEETRRFGIFLDNLKVVDHRNAVEIRHGGNEVHGVTKFADISQAEFEIRYLTSDPSMKSASETADQIVTFNKAPDATLGLIDWAGKYTTAVKDQGYCGSCWAFSATEQIESDAIRTLKVTYVLSPAQITQCDATCFGCQGGFTERAYNYVKKTGGLETEANYPYTTKLYQGITGSCASVSTKYVIGISGYTTVSGESSMATYVQTVGPLSVCVDANNWNSYTSGIMTTCGTSVDHCVQAVGVDASSTGYWKVRNSWATSWGEAGFIRLKYGANTCAITNDATYTTVTNL